MEEKCEIQSAEMSVQRKEKKNSRSWNHCIHHRIFVQHESERSMICDINMKLSRYFLKIFRKTEQYSDEKILIVFGINERKKTKQNKMQTILIWLEKRKSQHTFKDLFNKFHIINRILMSKFYHVDHITSAGPILLLNLISGIKRREMDFSSEIGMCHCNSVYTFISMWCVRKIIIHIFRAAFLFE